MSIPTYAEIRAALRNAGEPLEHPTKGPIVDKRGNEKPHKYGNVVYYDGGHIGIKYQGQYLVAEGDDHEDSALALAREIGFTTLDNGVLVRVLDEVDFKARALR